MGKNSIHVDTNDRWKLGMRVPVYVVLNNTTSTSGKALVVFCMWDLFKNYTIENTGSTAVWCTI